MVQKAHAFIQPSIINLLSWGQTLTKGISTAQIGLLVADECRITGLFVSR
jgi:hypothetical protein